MTKRRDRRLVKNQETRQPANHHCRTCHVGSLTLSYRYETGPDARVQASSVDEEQVSTRPGEDQSELRRSRKKRIPIA